MPSKTTEKPQPSVKLNGWPGPKSVELFEEEQKYIAPGNQSIALLSKLTIERGEGPWLWDVDQNKYLDFNVGVSVASLGYSHPKYIAAMRDQLEKVVVGSFTSEVRLKLMKLIASLAPGKLNRTQLFSGGAEAVEAAIRLARSYTKKTDVIGFGGGFHGKTAGDASHFRCRLENPFSSGTPTCMSRLIPTYFVLTAIPKNAWRTASGGSKI